MTRLATLGLLAALTASAQDLSWSLWGGPRRDFSLETALQPWPAAGPPKLWERPLGEGYSAIAADGAALYTMYRRPARLWQIFTEDQEVVVALDAAAGSTLWEFAYDAPFTPGYHRAGPGPYAMPQVAGELVFTVGATGKLHALRRKTGKLVWSRDLYEEFGGTQLTFGYSSHPLPYGDDLIVLAGGAGKAAIRLDQATGDVVWARLSFKNAHSTPILIRVDGQDQVVAVVADRVIAFDPGNGELLWSHPHKTEHGLAVATPIWAPDKSVLFFAAAYGFGAEALRLRRNGDRTNVEPLWRDNRIQLHFGNAVRIGETLFLTRGQSGPAFLTALDLESGAILWQSRDFPKAALLAVKDQLLLLDEEGRLTLAKADRQGLTVQATTQVLTPNAWTPPTLVGHALYLRDRRAIMALALNEGF